MFGTKRWERVQDRLAALEQAEIAVQRRLSEMNDRLRDLSDLPLQWASTQDILNRLANRLEKVQQRAQKAAQDDCEGCPDQDPSPGGDEITRRILERRNRKVGG